MFCKNCGYHIEKDFKFCPNCGKKITKKYKIVILATMIIAGIILLATIFITNIKGEKKINASYINNQLESKYDDKFDNIHLVKSVKNPDRDLGCDGSSFGTIKGKGTTEYYKAYSPAKDIEFFAYYDTEDNDKTIHDTYENYLARRNTIKKAYDTANQYLGKYINHIYISNDLQDMTELTSKDSLNQILSRFDDEIIDHNGDLGQIYDKIYVYIDDEQLFEFSRQHYDILTELNNAIVSLKHDYYFTMLIVFDNGAHIQLDRLGGKPYVYDKFGENPAWGEELSEFVSGEEYP